MLPQTVSKVLADVVAWRELSRFSLPSLIGAVAAWASVLFTPPAAVAQCGGTILSHRGGSATSVARSGEFLYVVFGDELFVYDVSTIDAPVQRGSVAPRGGNIVEIAVDGTKVYMIGRLGLIVVNANNPDNPVVSSVFAPAPDPYLDDITTSNQNVYLYDRLAHVIYVVNVSAPANPMLINTFAAPYITTDLAAEGNTLCVSSWEGIFIYDVTNPGSVVQLSVLGSIGGDDYYGIALRGNVLCAGWSLSNTTFDYEFRTADVSNPSQPNLRATLPVNAYAENIALNPAGTMAYTDTTADQVQIIDITPLTNPQIRATINEEALGLFASPNTLFTARGTNGLKAWDVSTPSSPTGRWRVTRQPETPTHMAANATRLVVADGTQLEVMDITTPGAPTTLNRLPIGQLISAVCVTGDLACVADEARTLTIVDLAAAGGAAVVGSVATVGIPSAIGADGNLVGVGTEANTLEVFDISNPAAPGARGVVPNLDGPGVSNPILDVKVRGALAYVSQNNIWIISLQNPDVPVVLSETYGIGEDLALIGPVLCTVDGYGVELFDVSDPTNPQSIWYDRTLYGDPEAVAVLESVMMLSGADGQVSFLDIANPEAPVLVDTMQRDYSVGAAELVVAGDRLWRLCPSLYALRPATGLWELSIPEHPRITSMPLDRTACKGELLALDVTAHMGSLGYRWYWNGIALSDGPTGHGSYVLGALSSGLRVLNAQPADSGAFHCVVTNGCGSSATRPANITISAMLGDLNCDCAVNSADVTQVVLALVDPAGYVATHPNCDINAADINRDGRVDGRDVRYFIALLRAP